MLTEAAAGSVPVEDHRFPCPKCGSDLRYDPRADAMNCDHCGHTEAVQARGGAIRELDLRKAAREADLPHDELEETRVVRCDSCGAQVEFDADLHARECPFCASPLVTDTGTHRHIKPQAQLPFLISREEAHDAMRRWLGRLWFAPSGLKNYARAGRDLQGIYVPYWTYDAETDTAYRGQRGTVYYETRPVRMRVKGKSRISHQKTAKVRWTSVSGRVRLAFDDVLVLGSRSLPKRFTDALAPWDLSALVPYEPRYLAGFRAEGYAVPVEEAYGEASTIMNAEIERAVRHDIGGDRQRIGDLQTDVGRLTYKHVLLPVWLAAYRFRGRTYRFVVNGRTGHVAGERPYSTWKIALVVIVGLALAAALAYLTLDTGGGFEFDMPLEIPQGFSLPYDD